MQYLANVLPVDPTKWSLNNATMTKDLITIEANGSVSTTLKHEDVKFTPKAFKVTVKFIGQFDAFSPAAFARLIIKDSSKKYQVFTAPFQVTSKGSGYSYMEAELVTNTADFATLFFQFVTEEHVEITEWKLYPSSDIDTRALNTIEAMMPQFLFKFNENAITATTSETEIVNLPFAMGEPGNLSSHLLFKYTANTACQMTVTIKLDGSPEAYAPIVSLVQEGPGFIGIPHAFLQVRAAAHLISVTVALTATSGTAPTITIPAKGIMYTCEGRGILDGASGEYPHAEVSDNYEYPAITLGAIQSSDTCNVTFVSYIPATASDSYTYPSVLTSNLDYFVDIPANSIKDFGVAEIWLYNTTNASKIHITGNLILTSDGLTFNAGVGEGIATYDALYPTESYIPVVNAIEMSVTGSPNIRFAFSTDGSTWYTLDGALTWHAIALTYTAMSTSGITPVQLAQISSGICKALFDLTGTNKLTVAVYMISSIAQTTFTLSSITAYYSMDDSNAPLVVPAITFAIPEDGGARIHWQVSADPPRAVKLYYGTTKQFGQSLESTVGATYLEVPNLTNRTKYYFAAVTTSHGHESAQSNMVSTVPTQPVPRIISCIAGIGTIALQWQIVGASYDSYNIYVGASAERLVFSKSTSDMHYTLDSLPNGVEYFVAVTGVNTNGESWYSEIYNAKPMLPVLEITHLSPGRDFVTITLALPDAHADYTGFVKYRVYYGTSSKSMTEYTESSGLNVTVKGLTTDTQYFFYATGLTATEESTPSETASASTTSAITFTSLGHTNGTKPTQADANAQYAQTVTIVEGIQKYVVPETGTYRIVATGAAGGRGGGAGLTDARTLGGFGAIITGDFDLNKNDELYMLIGQKASDNLQTSGDSTTGAGGGMSVVAIKDATQTDKLFSTLPNEWKNFTVYYYLYDRGDGAPYYRVMFDSITVNADKSITLHYNGSTTCPCSALTHDTMLFSDFGNFDMTRLYYEAPRVFINTNCKALITALTTLGVTFTDGLVDPPDFTSFNVPIKPLIVAGAGNGGGAATYGGTAGANALLNEGTDDGYLTTSCSGAGYKQSYVHNTCGSPFIDGGDAAYSVYTRNNYNSIAGFGGGGSNKADGASAGGGGGGYRGGKMGTSIGGSSYNAGANASAVLNTERTDGLIVIKKLNGGA